MLSTCIVSFDSFEDFNDFCKDLDSYHFHYLIHFEDRDDIRYFVVVLHKAVYNHFKVQEFLKSYDYKYKSFNRSLSSIF